jgi:hypothetical protein
VTEAQRGFGMLDRDLGLACPCPQNAADMSAPRIVRVERQRAVDPRHHSADEDNADGLLEAASRAW